MENRTQDYGSGSSKFTSNERVSGKERIAMIQEKVSRMKNKVEPPYEQFLST